MVIFHSYVNVYQRVSHFRNPPISFSFVSQPGRALSHRSEGDWADSGGIRYWCSIHGLVLGIKATYLIYMIIYIYIIIVLIYIYILYDLYIYIISSLYVLYYVIIYVCVYWYYLYIYIYMLFLKTIYGTPKTYLSSKFNGIYIVFLNPFNSKT